MKCGRKWLWYLVATSCADRRRRASPDQGRQSANNRPLRLPVRKLEKELRAYAHQRWADVDEGHATKAYSWGVALASGIIGGPATPRLP